MGSPWFMPYRPAAGARAHLFCMPYAGGGPTTFRGIERHLPETLDIRALALPGRHARIDEEPVHDLDALTFLLAAEVGQLADRPYAFFGHSMGAWIAFALTRRLAECGRPRPLALFVSGSRAPHIGFPEPFLHTASDTALKQRLARMKGAPSPTGEDDALFDLVGRALRADFRMMELWNPGPTVPLDVPIHVYGGRSDNEVPVEHLGAWSRHTRAAFTLDLFDGGHFFIHQALPEIARSMRDTFGQCLQP